MLGARPAVPMSRWSRWASGLGSVDGHIDYLASVADTLSLS